MTASRRCLLNAVLGTPLCVDHEEVRGSLGEAPADVMVVPDADAARRVQPRDPSRVAYTMQTTLAVDEAEEIAGILRERFAALSAPRTDDICDATTNRQAAVRAIASPVKLASAPPYLVNQIVHCLGGLGTVRATESRLVDKDVTFALPREVSDHAHTIVLADSPELPAHKTDLEW